MNNVRKAEDQNELQIDKKKLDNFPMLIFNVQFLVYKKTFVFAVYIYLSIHLSDNKLHKDFFFLSEVTLIILDSPQIPDSL